MCQMGLALRHRMTICQKLPKDFEQKLLNYQRYIANLRKTGNFLMGQIAKSFFQNPTLDRESNPHAIMIHI
jgi:hypothetical protein